MRLRTRGIPLLILPLAAAGADPSAPVILALAVIYVVALAGGELAARLGQPAVLGELLAGVVVGNLPIVGVTVFEYIRTDPGIDLVARIGVLILLFDVGVESTVRQMLSVGVRSLLVAILGVVVPFGSGWLVAAWLMPEAGPFAHAFVGATLAATSVGITARVLKDVGQSQTAEARIILGAAVIDDVLGLVVLAVVTGVIAAADTGAVMGYGAMGVIFGKAFGFLLGAVLMGLAVSPRVVRWSAALRTKGAPLTVSLALCFITAYLSYLLGLAPIIGAFAAGLVLESADYQPFRQRGGQSIEDVLHNLIQTFVPVFFVLMGMNTDLRALADGGVMALALILTAVAVVGKVVAGVAAGGGVNRLAVGIGMVPRGEVGLIFANIGLGLTIGGAPIVTPTLYSAIVMMVIITTTITPPGLKWAFGRRN
ncbi:MAG: cation:proton antiporter [Gemmatimonadales bacterium]|nr:cation:proton antiporter [Gemmatimonadales bacterium]